MIPMSRKEPTMRYKTIVLELLEQNPEFYERLRKNRILLATLSLYATELGIRQLDWERQIAHAKPGSNQKQIASEALELAVAELQDCLTSVSAPYDTEALSLDDAMTFIRRHTASG
jgi:hypothetical protein